MRSLFLLIVLTLSRRHLWFELLIPLRALLRRLRLHRPRNTRKTQSGRGGTRNSGRHFQSWLPLPAATPAPVAKKHKAPEPQATQAPGGGNGLVWVNTETHVYHKEGSKWYGRPSMVST